MKPRSISETQKMRALSLGITPILIQNPNAPQVYRTDKGCRVQVITEPNGDQLIELSTTGKFKTI